MIQSLVSKSLKNPKKVEENDAMLIVNIKKQNIFKLNAKYPENDCCYATEIQTFFPATPNHLCARQTLFKELFKINGNLLELRAIFN